MTTIRVSDTLKTQLKYIRDEEEHSSLDSTIRSLVNTYEYPIAPNGLADAFDRDTLAMLNRFNLEGLAIPLPTALEHYFGLPVHDDLTQHFRLYIGGWWLSNSQTANRDYTVPHFDAYSISGGFLFKFHTAADAPAHKMVNGCLEGDHWFLVDQADYEDAVLQVLDADGMEFLAPVGGVPEHTETGELAFGGYGAEGRSYWDHENHQPEHVPEWHDLRTVAEYIGDLVPDLQHYQQQYEEKVEQERREDKEAFIEKLREYDVDAVEGLDPDEVEGTDLLELVPDEHREEFENDDGNMTIPGGQVKMINLTLPVEKAIEYHVYSPDDVVAGTDDDESYTAQDLVDMGHEMDLPVHAPSPTDDIELLLKAIYTDSFAVNPHGFSEDEWIETALNEAGVLHA